MKITPYWSWTPSPNGLKLTNHLTGHAMEMDDGILDTLEHIYEHADAPAAAVTHIDAARNLAILFDSEAAENAWLDAWEREAWRETPIVDQIELTNRCPYRCGYCPRTANMRRPIGAMDLALFFRLLDQTPHDQGLIGLHNFGESLTHPYVVEAVAEVAQRGMTPGMSVNPPSLKAQQAKQLIDAGLGLLVFSLDSLRPETYRALRGPAAKLEMARHTVETTVALRDACGADLLIVLQMIDLHANNDEHDAFLSFCREVGVDYGAVVRFGLWDTEISDIARHGTFSSPGYLPYCRRPWDSVVVLWDGRVTPCCHDYDGMVVLGNAADETLSSIWAGEPARRFRQDNASSELCRRCMFGRWSREPLRCRDGFRAFHRNVAFGAERLEWRNPCGGFQKPLHQYNFFDVLTLPVR